MIHQSVVPLNPRSYVDGGKTQSNFVQVKTLDFHRPGGPNYSYIPQKMLIQSGTSYGTLGNMRRAIK